MLRFVCSLILLAFAALFAKADCGSYPGSCRPAGYGHARVTIDPPYRHAVDLFDGGWHYQPAGWFRGYWFPAGTYRWCAGRWHLRGYGAFRGFTSPDGGW